jgi:hypothetical protein
MFDLSLSIVLSHWPSTLLILVLGYLARNYFNHGLNRYPGPFLASLTNWWRFLDVYGRRPELTHTKLHRKYGDVVRLGPNVLSFGNPIAVKQIYGLNRGFVKVLDKRHLYTTWKLTCWSIVRLLSCADGCMQRQTSAIVVLNHRRGFPCQPPPIRQQCLLNEHTHPI